MFGGFVPDEKLPVATPRLMYASISARCQASSPIERPPGSGRKSYWSGGNILSISMVFCASRSHTAKKDSIGFILILLSSEADFRDAFHGTEIPTNVWR